MRRKSEKCERESESVGGGAGRGGEGEGEAERERERKREVSAHKIQGKLWETRIVST